MLELILIVHALSLGLPLT